MSLVFDEATSMVMQDAREARERRVMLIADRKYKAPLPDADWEISAADIVQVRLSLSLFKHVPGWPGATDEQLFDVAKEIIDALDKTPRAKF